MSQLRRALYFVGDSIDVLKALPRSVQHGLGTALRLAQEGNKAIRTRTPSLSRVLVARVFWRLSRISTVTPTALSTPSGYARGVYVLHCFQKKSKSGIATSKRDLDLIQRRLKLAIEQDKALVR